MATEKLAESAAIYRRNAVRMRAAIAKIEQEFDRYEWMFRSDILHLVRERFGCLTTQISDRDIESVLAYVKRLGELIINGKRAAEWKADAVAREQRETSNGHSAWYNNLVREVREIADRPRGAPALRLVTDCGRDLAPRDSSSPGPYSA